MQVYDELAQIGRQAPSGFYVLARLLGGEKAEHPMLFKVIGFTGKRTLGSIRFFGSLPCGFSKKDDGAQVLVHLLLRPQRLLLDFSPVMRSFAARSFRCRHSSCLSVPKWLFQAYLIPQKFARKWRWLAKLESPST